MGSPPKATDKPKFKEHKIELKEKVSIGVTVGGGTSGGIGGGGGATIQPIPTPQERIEAEKAKSFGEGPTQQQRERVREQEREPQERARKEAGEQLKRHGIKYTEEFTQKELERLSPEAQAEIIRQQEQAQRVEQIQQLTNQPTTAEPNFDLLFATEYEASKGLTLEGKSIALEYQASLQQQDYETRLAEYKTSVAESKQSRKELAGLLSSEEYKGAEIDILVGGKFVKTTSGQRAIYDIIKTSYQLEGQVTIQPYKTKSQREFVSSLVSDAKALDANVIKITHPYVDYDELAYKGKIEQGPKTPEVISVKEEEQIVSSLTKYQREGKPFYFSIVPSETILHEPGKEPTNPLGRLVKGYGETIKTRGLTLSELIVSPPLPGIPGRTPRLFGYQKEYQKFVSENVDETYLDSLLTGKPYTKSPEQAAGSIIADISLVATGRPERALPIRGVRLTVPVGEGKIGTIYRGVKLGYSEQATKLMFGRAGGKFVRGVPKPELVPLEKITPPSGRGGFPISEEPSGLLTRPEYKERLVNLGKITQEESELLTNIGAGLKEAGKIPDIVKRTELGKQPITSLRPGKETGKMFAVLEKEQKKIIEPLPPFKGSLIEQFYVTQRGLTPSRDIDVQFEGMRAAGLAGKKARTFAKELQPVAEGSRKFYAKGTRTYVSEAGRETKVFEGLTQKDVTPGSKYTDPSRVFGMDVPRTTTRLGKLKGYTYRFQGLRKASSVTELTPKGLRPARGREKDYLSLYNYFRTKAEQAKEIGRPDLAKTLGGRASFVKQFAQKRGLFPQKPSSLTVEIEEPQQFTASIYTGSKQARPLTTTSVSTAREKTRERESKYVRDISRYSQRSISSISKSIISISKPIGVSKSKTPPSPSKSVGTSPYKSLYSPSKVPSIPSYRPTPSPYKPTLTPQQPPYYPPSRPPSKPPYAPPYGPPSKPPYTPPYVPPFVPPIEPPPRIPFGFRMKGPVSKPRKEEPGLRADFLGNVRQADIEGIYKRTELTYGQKRINKLLRQDKPSRAKGRFVKESKPPSKKIYFFTKSPKESRKRLRL